MTVHTAIVTIDAPLGAAPPWPTASTVVDALWLSADAGDGVEHIHASARPDLTGIDVVFYLKSPARDGAETTLRISRSALASSPLLVGWSARAEEASSATPLPKLQLSS